MQTSTRGFHVNFDQLCFGSLTSLTLDIAHILHTKHFQWEAICKLTYSRCRSQPWKLLCSLLKQLESPTGQGMDVVNKIDFIPTSKLLCELLHNAGYIPNQSRFQAQSKPSFIRPSPFPGLPHPLPSTLPTLRLLLINKILHYIMQCIIPSRNKQEVIRRDRGSSCMA